jgi:ribosomal protein S18 acetylase RimI-like enzyme
MPLMTTSREYLEAYDRQLRTDAETAGAIAVERLGPLRLVTFAGGRGFVTYQNLGGAGAVTIAGWVGEALAHYRADAAITRLEWKTRGHDRAPGLHDALVSSGFVAGEPESVMIGEARRLAVDVALPGEVGLREVTSEPDVRAMCAMQAEVFGDSDAEDTADAADAVLRRLAAGDGMQLWVAEAGGQIVSAGRLEPVAGTEFAGIWGGATRPQWRGRGIYRALTAARARSALALGKRLMHSDSTGFSRPVLERAGLVKVSTTTPYLWRR